MSDLSRKDVEAFHGPICGPLARALLAQDDALRGLMEWIKSDPRVSNNPPGNWMPGFAEVVEKARAALLKRD